MLTDKKICRYCRQELDETGSIKARNCDCGLCHRKRDVEDDDWYQYVDFGEVHWLGMCAGVPYDDPRWIDYHEYREFLDDGDWTIPQQTPWVRMEHEAMDSFLLLCEEAAKR